ncbi:TPA: hypothetical protein EYM82_19455 [Candidatus Poribacteria bacterium]|nr:hypothetical protein [Candidatus Poribacteria bacterium]
MLQLVLGCSGRGTSFHLSPADTDILNPVLADLRLSYDLTSSLKMQMKVVIEEKGKAEEVREILWYKRSNTDGDLLHIQTMGVFNEPRIIAIAARGKFLLYFVNEREAILESLEDSVLHAIFGIDLRVSDVLSAIFANPFLDGRLDCLSLSKSGRKLLVKRMGEKSGHVEEVMILLQEPNPTITKWIIKDQDGLTVQETKFSDYRDVGGILRPFQVEIARPLDQTKVLLKSIKPEINIEISDQKFSFSFLPKNTKFSRIRSDHME